MSLSLLFLKSAGIGLAVAAPVGPMSILCMRRTLTEGWRSGLAVGLGIAAGDGAYAAIAALGLSAVSSFMLAWQRPLHIAAGLVLIWLGWRTWLAAKASGEIAPASGPRPGSAAFGGALLMTLTNPMTIVMFAAVFAALAPAKGMGLPGAAATVGGVFAGSMVLWCGVVLAVSLCRRAVGPKARAFIDRASALVLFVFGGLELRRAF